MKIKHKYQILLFIIIAISFSLKIHYVEKYSTFGDEPILLERNGVEESYYIKNPIHIQQPLIQNIVYELLKRGKSLSTGKTGAETNKIIDKILGRMV